MEAIPYVDELLQEYLLFRGFTKTLQSFNQEKAVDRGRGFQAEQLSSCIFGRLIPQYDSEGLVELLAFLRARIFSRLSSNMESQAAKLELSVLRLHIVHAIESSRTEQVQQFFLQFGEQLSKSPEAQEWEAWFALPFLQKPQAHPHFQVYFTKPWRKLVEASFRNYMAKAVTELPLPALLRFNIDRKQRQALQAQVENLQAELGRLKSPGAQQQSSRKGSLDLGTLQGVQRLSLRRRGSSSWANHLEKAELLDQSPRAETQRARSSGASQQALDPPSKENTSFQLLEFSGPSSMGQLENPVDIPPSLAIRSAPGSNILREERQRAHDSPVPSVGPSLMLSDMSDSDLETSRLMLDEPTTERFEWPTENRLMRDTLSDPDTGAATARRSSETNDIASASADRQSGRHGQHSHEASVKANDVQSLILEQENLQGHEAGISDVIFAPDGMNVASASTDGVVRIWAPTLLDGNTSRSSVLLTGGPVTRLAWDTRADKVMLIGTEGKGIKAWHLDTKRMVAHVRPEPAFPLVLDVACSPTEPSFLCSARGKEGQLSLWNLRAFRKVHSFRETVPLLSACFSADGRTVAATGDNGQLRLFDTGSATATAALAIEQGAGGPSFVRFVGPRETSLLTLSSDGFLRAWDSTMLRAPIWAEDVSVTCSKQRNSRRHRFAAASEGTAIALTSESTVGYVLSGLFGNALDLRSYVRHKDAISAVAWHPKERIIATGSLDRTITIARLRDL